MPGREVSHATVMRCDDRGNSAFAQLFNDGAGEGGALIRVGACPKLIQQHQRSRASVLEDVDDGAHVRREGGYRALNALGIANVGMNRFERRDP